MSIIRQPLHRTMKTVNNQVLRRFFLCFLLPRSFARCKQDEYFKAQYVELFLCRAGEFGLVPSSSMKPVCAF